MAAGAPAGKSTDIRTSGAWAAALTSSAAIMTVCVEVLSSGVAWAGISMSCAADTPALFVAAHQVDLVRRVLELVQTDGAITVSVGGCHQLVRGDRAVGVLVGVGEWRLALPPGNPRTFGRLAPGRPR